jgi:hypothetical protein
MLHNHACNSKRNSYKLETKPIPLAGYDVNSYFRKLKMLDIVVHEEGILFVKSYF